MRLFSFGSYGLALAVFGAYDSYPSVLLRADRTVGVSNRQLSWGGSVEYNRSVVGVERGQITSQLAVVSHIAEVLVTCHKGSAAATRRGC